MKITEEALYEAAPEAAERFLSTLPGREACAHDFSPEFEARMRPLLRRRGRRSWRALLAAAAVVGALAAGLSAGAGSQTDCQIYWSQTDGELRYVIRLEHETVQPFRAAELEEVPEGFAPVRESVDAGTAACCRTYQRGEDAFFTLKQTRGEDLVGSKGTACRGSEVEVNGRLGLLVEETDSTGKDLLWTDGPYIFSLHAEGLSANELLEIAKDVTW